MLASLFGALVGGLFAVMGGWLAIHWQAAREARGVASTLLAEMAVTQRLLESGGNAEIYQKMLDEWRADQHRERHGLQ